MASGGKPKSKARTKRPRVPFARYLETRTKKSALLRKLYPKDPYVEINPEDAERKGIAPNEFICVESRRACVKVKAYLTFAVQPGQVFMPMHYEETNQLTFASFDPYSRQPSYKACAVHVYRKDWWNE